MKTHKYIYPAIFTTENCGFSIRFPDLEGCYTSAETLEEAMENAEDVLCLTLYDLEERGKIIPKASKLPDVTYKNHEFSTLISCDTIEYRKFFDKKSVKKTLTIPGWLNDMAEQKNINFSGLLQEALKTKLNIG